ncbi:hypothetical protein Glove_22g26 [Diversispora epigaea]|uniref:TRP C-terminal domain-containing protein n=1 Tax=Diversispora epigaea TaxID=1348612 RepID=A0A397JNX7_9GLOM|nr:hypothetical protein Glove_22g26 [Diversispora epigaea]
MANAETNKLSITGKITLTSVVLQAIVVTVLECLVIYYHVTCVSLFKLNEQGQGISEADLIYHAIFILALFFQIVLAVDSIMNNNTIQLISLVIFNLLSLVYAGIQLYQHRILEDIGLNNAEFKFSDVDDYPTAAYAIEYFRSKMRPLEYVIIGIVAGFSVYLALVSFKLSIEFGWKNYRTYSADLRIRKAYILLSILQTLIKVDVFFVGAYAIQLIPSQKIGYSSSIAETVLIFVCGTLLLLMAWFSVSHELKFVLIIVINCLVFSLIYFVWKLIKVNMKPKEGVDPYVFTRKFLTFFLSVTTLLIITTIIYASLCFRNMIRNIYVFTLFGAAGMEGGEEEEDISNDRRQSALVRIFESKKDSANRQSMINTHIRDRRESRLSLD